LASTGQGSTGHESAKAASGASVLADYLRPEGRKLAALAVVLVAGTAVQLASPQIIRTFIDTAAQGEAVGIDLVERGAHPKILDAQVVERCDVVITMGCGDNCPFFPGVRYLDWVLEDPAGQGVESVRPIRDEIERRVRELIAELSA
jgi:arsenate reductase